MNRVQILSGVQRRRRFSSDEKKMIVAESLTPGASASAVARRHDIAPSLLYVWKKTFAKPKEALIVSPSSENTFVRLVPSQPHKDTKGGVIRVRANSGVVVEFPVSVDLRQLAIFVASLGG